MELEDTSKTDLIGEFNWACIRKNYIHKCCQNNYLQWNSVSASFFILGILHCKMLWIVLMTISMAKIYTNMAIHCMAFDAIRVENDIHELQNCICVLLLNLGKVKIENFMCKGAMISYREKRKINSNLGIHGNIPKRYKLNFDFCENVLFILGHDEDELVDRKLDELQKLVSCGDANIFGKVTYFCFAMSLSYILFALVGFESVFSVMGSHNHGCCGFEHESVSKSSSMMCTFSSKLLQ